MDQKCGGLLNFELRIYQLKKKIRMRFNVIPDFFILDIDV